MTVDNNEKILNLISGHHLLEPEMTSYLSKLKKLKIDQDKAKDNFGQIKNELYNICTEIHKTLRIVQGSRQKFDELLIEIQTQAQKLNDQYVDNHQQDSKILLEIMNLSTVKFRKQYIVRLANTLGHERDINSRYLLDKLSRLANMYIYKTSDIRNLSSAAKKLDQFRNEDFGRYRPFYVQRVDILQSNLQNIINQVSGINIDNGIIEELHSVINQIPELSLPKFPSGSKALNIIHKTRKGNMYIKRGYSVLKYTKKVYQALTRLRRTLSRKTQYVSCNNAWQNYLKAIGDLENYYNAHYVQAGGRPQNYHGHRANEKP